MLRYFCLCCNVTIDEAGSSAWFRRFGEHFARELIPFGALVDFVPPPEDGVPKPKTTPRAVPGIYLGWVRYAGHKVGPDSHVIDLKELKGMNMITGLVKSKQGYRKPRVQRSTRVF